MGTLLRSIVTGGEDKHYLKADGCLIISTSGEPAPPGDKRAEREPLGWLAYCRGTAPTTYIKERCKPFSINRSQNSRQA